MFLWILPIALAHFKFIAGCSKTNCVEAIIFTLYELYNTIKVSGKLQFIYLTHQSIQYVILEADLSLFLLAMSLSSETQEENSVCHLENQYTEM